MRALLAGLLCVPLIAVVTDRAGNHVTLTYPGSGDRAHAIVAKTTNDRYIVRTRSR